MNTRGVLIGFSWMACLATLVGFLVQRQQLIGLKALGDQPVANPRASSASPPESNVRAASENTVSSAEPDPSELLRLRSEITRLNARKRELSASLQQSERPVAQIGRTADGSGAVIQVPSGYMRKKDAQPVGYATPENALQSFLWALQHHDITNVLRSLAPADAQKLSSQIASSADFEQNFFKGTEALPGMLLKDRKNFADGSMDVEVEVIPGLPPQSLHLRPINGEWKIENGF